jgi:hypothetical protein
MENARPPVAFRFLFFWFVFRVRQNFQYFKTRKLNDFFARLSPLIICNLWIIFKEILNKNDMIRLNDWLNDFEQNTIEIQTSFWFCCFSSLSLSLQSKNYSSLFKYIYFFCNAIEIKFRKKRKFTTLTTETNTKICLISFTRRSRQELQQQTRIYSNEK